MVNVDSKTEPKISREKIVGKIISSKFPSVWTSFPLLGKLIPIGVLLFGELRTQVAVELSLLYETFRGELGVRRAASICGLFIR